METFSVNGKKWKWLKGPREKNAKWRDWVEEKDTETVRMRRMKKKNMKKIEIKRRLRNCLEVIIEFKRKCWLKNESEKGNPWLLLSKQWYHIAVCHDKLIIFHLSVSHFLNSESPKMYLFKEPTKMGYVQKIYYINDFIFNIGKRNWQLWSEQIRKKLLTHNFNSYIRYTHFVCDFV